MRFRSVKTFSDNVRSKSVIWLIAIFTAAVRMSVNQLQAAPLTLQFEAVIGPPRQGAVGPLPPDWSDSLQQGEIISGVFTIEPFDAASNTNTTALVQPFDFSIHVKSRTLTTTQYGIEVFNDHTSDDAPQPTDNINVGCSLFGRGAICVPSAISPTDLTEWSFGVAMYGDSILLDGADIPPNPSTWQHLILDNTMLVSFKDPAAGWAYGFLATIESIQAVPEPSALLIVFIGGMILLTHRVVLGPKRV